MYVFYGEIRKLLTVCAWKKKHIFFEGTIHVQNLIWAGAF